MLTDEQIIDIYLDHRDKMPNIEAARAIEAEVRKDQADQIAELTRQLAEARKDSERYRVLRDGNSWPAVFSNHDAPEPLRGEDLDAAIKAKEQQ